MRLASANGTPVFSPFERKVEIVEINLKLEAGTYPVEIDYISTGGQDSLSLFWLPPGEKYFRLVPEEVLGS